ncbi:hypothetical protein MJ575_11635 [Klebsiella pneumoniae]|nr:hypothetical protein MJ575_11635 [Klebsiella pneumoniae]
MKGAAAGGGGQPCSAAQHRLAFGVAGAPLGARCATLAWNNRCHLEIARRAGGFG